MSPRERSSSAIPSRKCTTISGIRGLTDITEDGVSGCICGTDDVQQYADCIRKLKDDPDARMRMGERNRKTIEAFTIGQTKREILQLIRELLS